MSAFEKKKNTAEPEKGELSMPLRAKGGKLEWCVPDISDDRLSALMKTIKPVCRKENGKLFHIKNDGDPRKTTFSWSPKYTKQAKDLVEICQTYTFHKGTMFFKPSVAEVLAQIPEDVIDKVVAFETVYIPSVETGIKSKAPDCIHSAVTTWYASKQNS